jgi:hypothetical protein
MQVLDTPQTVQFTIDFLESIFDLEGFKIITWGLEPVDGYYHIKKSVADHYEILS